MTKIYLLSIKRSNVTPKEMMGAFSSLSKAKEAVKNVYYMYDEMCKKMNLEKNELEEYDEKMWERHPQYLSYFFYPLNNSGTAFFEIHQLVLNEQALSFRKPTGESIDNYINESEHSEKHHKHSNL